MEYWIDIQNKGMSAKPQINLKSIMLVKEARNKQLHTVWFHLYDILENLKQKGQEINQWLPGTLEPRQRRLTTRQAPRYFLKLNGAVLYVDCAKLYT